ncbi:hypothetical protein NFI96_032251 [Prochilodus magdalenae]|nr:hypothetical protein NFI96_032251 [Prochilodus magdalenae]
MERSRAVLLTLVCSKEYLEFARSTVSNLKCGWCAAGVLFSGISGSEVEMRVRPGDNVTLYSDCVWRIWEPVWIRNSSNEDQTPLIISTDTLIQAAFSRYYFVWNQDNQTNDLLVRSVSESDLGLYYCALWEKKFMKDGTGAEVRRDVYRYGNRTTRLSLLGEKKGSEGQSENQENQKRTKCSEGGGADGGADGVVYTQVNITSRGQTRLKKNRVELSDICTYSEVVYDQT